MAKKTSEAAVTDPSAPAPADSPRDFAAEQNEIKQSCRACPDVPAEFVTHCLLHQLRPVEVKKLLDDWSAGQSPLARGPVEWAKPKNSTEPANPIP